MAGSPRRCALQSAAFCGASLRGAALLHRARARLRGVSSCSASGAGGAGRGAGEGEGVGRGSKLVVVGLGNPGAEFDGTRHNMGFAVVSELLRRNGGGTFRSAPRLSAGVARVALHGRAVHLAQPRTFMNASGRAARALLDYHAAPRAALLVVADDMALPLGRLRLRARGSAGGHNGLRSVEAALGSREFARLRVGVGAPRAGAAGWRGHVLGKFAKGELSLLDDALWDACEVVEAWARDEQFQAALDALSRIQGARNSR